MRMHWFRWVKQLLPYGAVVFAQRECDRRYLEKNPPPPPPSPPPVYVHEDPELYNADGQRLSVFYLKDDIFRHMSHSLSYGRTPSWVFWDRGDPYLKRHFYTHKNILKQEGRPEQKFAMMIESEAIVPEDYRMWDENPLLYREFDGVFTNSQRLLESVPNAHFIPASTVWVGTDPGTGTMSENAWRQKNKNVSMLSSNKCLCPMHEVRYGIAQALLADNMADLYGTINGGAYCDLEMPLTEYRYSVIVENAIEPYLFTEKILNCFATMTVPVYTGATEIGRFFNPDGIIEVPLEKADHIPEIARACTPADYRKRMPAIIDNYNRVLEYVSIEEYLLRHYETLLQNEEYGK